MAGFAKFIPIPPKSCLTTIMATTEPKAACQSGMETGRLNARSMPVTTAERSPTVTGFLHNFSKANSNGGYKERTQSENDYRSDKSGNKSDYNVEHYS